jgi:hypothetical protein
MPLPKNASTRPAASVIQKGNASGSRSRNIPWKRIFRLRKSPLPPHRSPLTPPTDRQILPGASARMKSPG